MNRKLLLRILTLGLALCQPLIILYFYGFNVVSISSMWGTNLELLFILNNVAVSYYFLKTNNWFISAIFLIALTVFNFKDFKLLHNILAVL